MKKLLVLVFVAMFMFSCQKATSAKSEGVASFNKADIQQAADAFVKKMGGGMPGMTSKIINVEKSPISGIAKVRVEVKQGKRGQRFSIYMTNDTKYIIMGQVFPTNGNPRDFKPDEVSFVDQSMIDTSGAPKLGPDNAPVTIVIFEDFQCPYCGRFYGNLEKVLKKYQNKVKIVYKTFPLERIHPWSKQAALAAQCAYNQSNDKFWDFYNYFYKNQREFSKDNIEKKSEEFAKKIGLNIKKYKECLKDKKTEAEINKQMKDGAMLGVRSTPTFIVNGTIYQGALSEEDISKAIDKALSGK